MDDARQVATQALQRMDQQMDDDNMDADTRLKILEYAHMQRKLLRQQLTPAQQAQIDLIPFSPSPAPMQQHQGHAQAPAQVVITGQAYSRDDFEKGSMRYLRKIVALQQLAYATLWQVSEQTPAAEQIQQEAAQTFLHAVQPALLTATALQDLEEINDHCQQTITSYALATLPRAMERVELDNYELIGINTVDGERIKKTLR